MLQTHGGHGIPPNPLPKPLLLSSSSNKPSIPQPTNNLSSSTSASLLSLLPLLPRAQSLLLQMSSLSSKLFDLSPNRSHWSSSYRGSLPSFLPSSSSSSISPVPSPSSTKELLSIIHSLQPQLFESVSQLQDILDLQDSSTRLSRDIRSKDSSLLSFSRKLRESESVLVSLIGDYSDYRSGRRNNHLDLNELLAYAHKISYNTFAPPEHGAGLVPFHGALPPAPQDNEMRASQLYHFVDLDVGVPKKPVLDKGRDGNAVDKCVDGAHASEGGISSSGDYARDASDNRAGQVEAGGPGGVAPGGPADRNAGRGWPGDPMLLPPLDEVVGMGVGREEVKVGVGRVMEKAPEVIMVRPVKLDIDEEDYSSDYSSDGS